MAALGADDGCTDGKKYVAWAQKHMVGPPTPKQADLYYGLRCSLLHQGSPYPHTGGPRMVALYPTPGSPQLHMFDWTIDGETVAAFSIPMFVDDVITSAGLWLSRYGATTLVQQNLERFVRLRPEGLPPHFRDVPVIA